MRRVIVMPLVLAFFLLVNISVCKAAESEKVGTLAPTFTEQLLYEGELNLSDYLGKKVIMLDYWSIYCVSCVQEMPHLAAIQKKYPDDLVTIGVDLDSFGAKRVQDFVKKQFPDLPYQIILDKKRKVAGLYSVSVLPTTIVIGKDKKILFYHVGYKPGDEKTIEDVIKKATGK